MLEPGTLETSIWLETADRRKPPRARSLLLTLLGEFVLTPGQPVWTSTFLSAFEQLGIGEAAGRQALKRSAAGGWLEAERIGRQTRWRLTAAMRQTLLEGAERIYSFGTGQHSKSDGWLMLQVSVPESRRKLRASLRTRLSWLGFGSIGQGVWICADSGREHDLRRALAQLGLEERATLFRGAPASEPELKRVVQKAWRLEALADSYRGFLAELERHRVTSDAAAFVALTRLVHRWRAFPFVDPQLPKELEPQSWQGKEAAKRFHQLRERWSPPAQRWWQSTCGD